MFAVIGIVIGLVCVMLGYTMHGGRIDVLVQPTEYIIIFGGAAGIFLATAGMDVAKQTMKQFAGMFKSGPKKEKYVSALRLLYKLFSIARKDGLLGLEKHIETPEESEVFAEHPEVLADHHAVAFLCDTMKVVLTGAVSPHDLSELMELDLETAHEQEMKPSAALTVVADAMPAVGIIAAVLGIVITMGKIGGDPAAIGMSVAVALVGTFLGILSGYVIVSPLANALAARVEEEHAFLNAIRHALFSFARGESPITCVEFARRSIDPTFRPGFVELEAAVKEKREEAA